jgi:putative flippase GtrA
MIDKIKELLKHDTHPAIQFIKYIMAGGTATAVHIMIFFLCGWFLLPCITQDDILVKLFGLTAPEIADGVRKWRAASCNGIAFFISNTLCYFLNILFVFKPGKHNRIVEFLLFFVVSGISMIIGTAIQTFLIGHYQMQTTFAFVANILSALVINFAMRKFFIFKG